MAASVLRAAATDLIQRARIDGDADLALHPGEVLGVQVFGAARPQRFVDALDVGGLRIERRHFDLVDAKHAPRDWARTARGPGLTLRRLERLVDDNRRQPGRWRTALEGRAPFNLEFL